MIKLDFKVFLLILFIIASPIVLSDDENASFTVVKKYNVLYEKGLPESYQLIEFNNLNKPLHPITIFVSYPDNAQFKSILQIPGKNTSKTHLNEVQLSNEAFEKLISKISDEYIKPPKDYNKKVFKVHLPENDTLNVEIMIIHNNIDEKKWYVNVLGSSGGSSLIYESGDYSVFDLPNNIWWRKLKIKNPISQETILRFPHNITEGDIGLVIPIRVQYPNETIIEWGANFTYEGGTEKLYSYNSSDVDWKIPFAFSPGDFYYPAFGKIINFTGGSSINYEFRSRIISVDLESVPDIVNLTIHGANITEDVGISGWSCTSDPKSCGGCQGECLGSGICPASGTSIGTGGSFTFSGGNVVGYNKISTSGSCSYGACLNNNCNCQVTSGTPSCSSGPGILSCSCSGSVSLGNSVSITNSYGAPSSSGSALVVQVPLNISVSIGGTDYTFSSEYTWMTPNITQSNNSVKNSLIAGRNSINATSKTRGNLYIFFERQVKPIVTLVSPQNNTVNHNGNITFNCITTDDYGLSNITLYTDINGTWSPNQTKTISGLSNSTIFSINNIANNTVFKWNCMAYNSLGNSDWADSNWTVNILYIDNEWVCADVTECEYQTITDALEGENNTNNTIHLIDPTTYTVEKTITYTFLSTAIEFRNNTQTLDCNGSTIKGIGIGMGLDLDYFAEYNDELENITILNCNIDWFNSGINSNARLLTIKNTTSKNNDLENIRLGVGVVSGDYITYLEDIILYNSSTEEGIQANAGGLTNITLINVNSSFNKKSNLVLSLGYYKVINSYFYNSTSDHCVQLGGNDVEESLFANNTIKYCYTDNKAGLALVNVGNERLLVENNTITENNINLVLNTASNLTIRNNTINVSYELDYVSGIGFNVGFLDKTANTTFTGNWIYNSAENGIAFGNTGGGALNNINISNNSIYNTSASWDFYIATSDVYNVSVWLNNFYSKGVNNGSVDIDSALPNFCVDNEGNFYEENTTFIGYNDCGIVKLTYPIGGENITSSPINITWTKQSSFNPINYYLYYSNGTRTDYSYDNDENCILSMPFEENTGSITEDMCLNNNGTLKNGTTDCYNSDCPTWSNGRYGYALEFDGKNDYVQINDDISLRPDRISVEAWVKVPVTISNIYGIVHHYQYDYYLHLHYPGYKANPRFAINGLTDQAVSSVNIDDGEWHHLVGTYDNTTASDNIKIYVDGVLRGTYDYTTPIGYNVGSPVYIGAWADGTHQFNGSIDSVLIYNRTLNSSEISEHYNRFKWYYIDNTNNLNYLWNITGLPNGNDYKVRVKPNDGIFGIYNQSGNFSISLREGDK